MRSTRSPLAPLDPFAREPRAGPLVVSVMPPPYTGENALMCAVLPAARLSMASARGAPADMCPARRSVGGGCGRGDAEVLVESARSGGWELLSQLRDGPLEVLRRIEGAVHRGEPQIRDEVEVLERTE